MRDSGEFEAMPKKEALLISRELGKLERNLGGIRQMEKRPDAVFVLDTKKEHIAVTEANKLGIPLVAVVDTNCDPDIIQYVIPGNDDAIRSANLMARVIADAVDEGRHLAQKRGARAGTKSDAPPPKPLTAEEQKAKAEAQAKARNEAAAQQAAREQRLLESKAKKAAEPAAEPATEGSTTAVATEERPAATETEGDTGSNG
jgi:small subunit ribosomal protein S2